MWKWPGISAFRWIGREVLNAPFMCLWIVQTWLWPSLGGEITHLSRLSFTSRKNIKSCSPAVMSGILTGNYQVLLYKSSLALCPWAQSWEVNCHLIPAEWDSPWEPRLAHTNPHVHTLGITSTLRKGSSSESHWRICELLSKTTLSFGVRKSSRGYSHFINFFSYEKKN